jgi:membrane-bound metal-dependent hydrolase YbcI (DUF457 family)
MLKRTHFAIGVFAAIFFYPHVNNPWIFVPVVLVAGFFPQLDYAFSILSKTGVMRPMQQAFINTRGIFHSFTVCLILSVVLAFYFPVYAFPFFLGYSLHLLADAWTVDGIRPFWPLQEITNGRVRTGGTLEETIFFVFVVFDILFLVLLFI